MKETLTQPNRHVTVWYTMAMSQCRGRQRTSLWLWLHFSLQRCTGPTSPGCLAIAWLPVWYVTLHQGRFASSVCGPCLLALVLLCVPAWLCPCAFHWTSYMCSPSGLCATLAAMANARERERERSTHLSSHTRLIRVLPGHPLADPKR